MDYDGPHFSCFVIIAIFKSTYTYLKYFTGYSACYLPSAYVPGNFAYQDCDGDIVVPWIGQQYLSEDQPRPLTATK